MHGVVVKATSGLYSSSNPDKGSCAKTLARHGEVCANRPYIVPQSIINQSSTFPPTTPGAGAGSGALPETKPDAGSGAQPKPDAGAGTGASPKPDDNEPKYHAGPLITKRSDEVADQPLGDWKKADTAANLVFKRDVGAPADPVPASGAPAPAPAPGTPGYKTDVTASGSHSEVNGPAGTICIDTVKRDKQITKVVPTKAKKAANQPGTPLHFELVRSDDKAGVWNQIIYDPHGNPIDVTHLELTSQMSFWRAEYYCAECKPGHKKHTVFYENVEIEVDEVAEHALPTVQCEGEAQSTNVHKREKSRYQHKNKSGVAYKGTIYSIDRVMLGSFDAKGKGGISASIESQAHPISGEGEEEGV